MRGVFGFSTGVVAGLTVGVLAWPAPASAAESAADKLSAVLFSGMEVETATTFLSTGGKLGLSLSGQTRMFVLGASGVSLSDLRLMRDGKRQRREVAAEARLFIGLERSFGQFYASAGVGPSIAQYLDRRGAAIRRAGIAAQFDLRYRPSNAEAIHATALLDTSQRSAWMRLRYGYRLAALPASLGPEISYGVSRGTQKFKLGLHASEFRLGPATFAIAGGAMWEQHRPGAYLSLASYASF